jgi:hypothetical protein
VSDAFLATAGVPGIWQEADVDICEQMMQVLFLVLLFFCTDRWNELSYRNDRFVLRP